MKVAETIRNCRKFRGWTQRRLAEKSGVNVTQISLYELGKTNPRVDVLEELLDAMGFELTITTKGYK